MEGEEIDGKSDLVDSYNLFGPPLLLLKVSKTTIHHLLGLG